MDASAGLKSDSVRGPETRCKAVRRLRGLRRLGLLREEGRGDYWGITHVLPCSMQEIGLNPTDPGEPLKVAQ